LFREQVSKQFQSISSTSLEDVIFFMAPLNLVMAIVSTVRTRILGWLEAVFARIRECTAVIEVKITASISHDVCELWSGQAIL
ncbi:hypothetical protein HOY80DRAFT_876021, partial [Tuber brumale]